MGQFEFGRVMIHKNRHPGTAQKQRCHQQYRAVRARVSQYLETNMNRLLGRLQSLALSALIIGPIWANDFFEQWFDGPGEIDG